MRQSIALFRGLYATGLDVEEVIRLCALEKLRRAVTAASCPAASSQRLLLRDRARERPGDAVPG